MKSTIKYYWWKLFNRPLTHHSRHGSIRARCFNKSLREMKQSGML